MADWHSYNTLHSFLPAQFSHFMGFRQQLDIQIFGYFMCNDELFL